MGKSLELIYVTHKKPRNTEKRHVDTYISYARPYAKSRAYLLVRGLSRSLSLCCMNERPCRRFPGVNDNYKHKRFAMIETS